MSFPIDLSAFQPLELDPGRESLTDGERATLAANVQLCRDAIVFFTATGAAASAPSAAFPNIGTATGSASPAKWTMASYP